MNISSKIGAFDFWGMLIPGCTIIWAIRIAYDSLVAKCLSLPWMGNDIFKWAVFLVTGYLLGLVISMIMDFIWRLFGWRNNKDHIIKALKKLCKGGERVLFYSKKFADLEKDTIKVYNKMYMKVSKAYNSTPIPALENQTVLMRNMILPACYLSYIIIAFYGKTSCCAILAGLLAIFVLFALTKHRQMKTYVVVLDYYASLPENDNGSM